MPKFVPRERKHKRRQQDAGPPVDTNATEIMPISKAEKDARRQKLREELRAQQPKISSKKQKRLDKYIVWARAPWPFFTTLISSTGK